MNRCGEDEYRRAAHRTPAVIAASNASGHRRIERQRSSPHRTPAIIAASNASDHRR
jgi:hypothetical protein